MHQNLHQTPLIFTSKTSVRSTRYIPDLVTNPLDAASTAEARQHPRFAGKQARRSHVLRGVTLKAPPTAALRGAQDISGSSVSLKWETLGYSN